VWQGETSFYRRLALAIASCGAGDDTACAAGRPCAGQGKLVIIHFPSKRMQRGFP